MTHSAGFRGRKMAASAMSKDDELYGSSVRDTNGEPLRNGMVSKTGNAQQSETRSTTGADHRRSGRNR